MAEPVDNLSPERVPGGGDDGIRVIGLGFAGRRDEARKMLAQVAQAPPSQTFKTWTLHLAAWLDHRIDDMLSTLSVFAPLKIFDDPEAIFQESAMFCDVGEHQRGLEYLQRAVSRGYFPSTALTEWPQFDALRDDPVFQSLLADADAGRQRAQAAFREAGGERLLAR